MGSDDEEEICMKRITTVRDEEYGICKAYGQGGDADRAQITTFIYWNDEDSNDNDVEANVTPELRENGRVSVEKDEGKNKIDGEKTT